MEKITMSIHEMDEAELRRFCHSHGIKCERQDFVILTMKGEKQPDIAIRLGYSLNTIKKWSRICKDKLKIDSWKP